MSQLTNAVETWLEDPIVSWTLFFIFIFVFIPMTVFIFKLSIDVEHGPANTPGKAKSDQGNNKSPVRKMKKVNHEDNIERSDEPSLRWEEEDDELNGH